MVTTTTRGSFENIFAEKPTAIGYRYGKPLQTFELLASISCTSDSMQVPWILIRGIL